MNTATAWTAKIALAVVLLAVPAAGAEIALETPTGDSLMVYAQAGETVFSVKRQMEQLLGYPVSRQMLTSGSRVLSDRETLDGTLCEELRLHITDATTLTAASLPSSPPGSRDYNTPLSNGDRNGIGYIVTTLANHSKATILLRSASLSRTGDKVNGIHPLKFLACIFTDEALKVAIRNLRTKPWEWQQFFEGLADSLNEESQLDNMKDAYINDFARTVGINASLVYSSIRGRQWLGLVDTLIQAVPRQGNPRRYDM